MTFALYFGNRGNFPSEVFDEAIQDMTAVLSENGFSYLFCEREKTRYGAVETMREGEVYAAFLEENRGKYDGVILCLPNFGDENGMQRAFRDVDVPILVQAYPDEIGKLGFKTRRDAFCGKFAACNVLRQMKKKYTQTTLFACAPRSESFRRDLLSFAATCRVVRGMKHVNIGVIGARSTAFKTMRTDEIALQNVGVNVETLDLSSILERMKSIPPEPLNQKKKALAEISENKNFPDSKIDLLARFAVSVDEAIAEYKLDAIAVRCWSELETLIGIAPCIILGELSDRLISAACETDITNALMMHALRLASDSPAMLLDMNNNYGEDESKCIVFHCGPVAPSLMGGKGELREHLLFKKSFGDGSGVGLNCGNILSGMVTIGSIRTDNGTVCAFVGHAELTDDPIDVDFFGTGKVMKKENLPEVLHFMADNGFKHHTSMAFGSVALSVYEAFTKYLGYECTIL